VRGAAVGPRRHIGVAQGDGQRAETVVDHQNLGGVGCLLGEAFEQKLIGRVPRQEQIGVGEGASDKLIASERVDEGGH
jgi:hypothetical protein